MMVTLSEDRIVKAFKDCDSNKNGKNCINCPYNKYGDECFQSLHEDAMNLLKHNIPMEPLIASESHRKNGYKHDCPQCHWALGYKEESNNVLLRIFGKTILHERDTWCCPFCGQAIDWEYV